MNVSRDPMVVRILEYWTPEMIYLMISRQFGRKLHHSARSPFHIPLMYEILPRKGMQTSVYMFPLEDTNFQGPRLQAIIADLNMIYSPYGNVSFVNGTLILDCTPIRVVEVDPGVYIDANKLKPEKLEPE